MNYNEARVELVLIGLNRKYPQSTEWKFSERPDGDLRFTTDDQVRIFPLCVFNDCPGINDVWDHIEKYWNVKSLEQFSKDAKDADEYGAAFGKIVGHKHFR